MAVNDPTQSTQPTPVVTLQDVVTPIVQQAVASMAVTLQQAVGTTTSDLQQRVTTLEQQLADTLAKQAPQAEVAVLQASTGVLADLEHDPVTQRVIIWGIAGAVMVGALAILVFAMLGNATANRWIGAAPGAAVALVLWLSNAGVVLPKPKPVAKP